MSYIYNVRTYSPRTFSRHMFLKNGNSAFIKIEGDKGTIECEHKIPEKDLHFIFTTYNLVDELIYTEKKSYVSTRVTTTTYNVLFSEDL